MKEIGLFYAMNAAKTSHIAEKIREKLGHKEVEMIMIEKAWQNDFQAYDNLIVGASTWFDGELPTYWDEMIPEIESLDLKDKKVALSDLVTKSVIPIILLTAWEYWLMPLKRQGLSLSDLRLPRVIHLTGQEP